MDNETAKYMARGFTCILADALDLPSYVCEQIESKLTDGKYEEVIYFAVRYNQEKKEMATAIIETTKSPSYWSGQITQYCGENGISLRTFAEQTGLHYNTVLDIVNKKTKKIQSMTVGILWNKIIKNQ